MDYIFYCFGLFLPNDILEEGGIYTESDNENTFTIRTLALAEELVSDKEWQKELA